MNTKATLKIISLSLQEESQREDLLPYHIFDNFIQKIEQLSASELSKNCDNITALLNRLPLLGFSLLLNHIDSNYPGLSFYYVMEAKQSKSIEGSFFIKRLKILQQNNLLPELFASMRCRLIEGLLEDSSPVIENALNAIRFNFDLPEESMEKIKSILLTHTKNNLPFLSEEDLLLLLDFN